MPEQESISQDDRVALSVMLAAGADPQRLALWFADNGDRPHSAVVAAVSGLQAVVAVRVASLPGRRRPLIGVRGAASDGAGRFRGAVRPRV